MKNRLLFLLLYMTVSSHAQTTNSVVVRDLESWTTIGLNKKLSEAFTLKLDQGLRLNSNSSSINQVLTDFALTYTPIKILSFSGGVRYAYNKTNSGDFENNLRLHADFGVKHDWNRFTFQYRLRLQTQNELGYTKSEGDFNINGQRLKAEIGYNINNWKFDPTVSAEIFRESGRYILPSFNKIRFTLGTEYKVKKIGELGIFYRLEHELGVTYPLTAHILGVNFTFNL